MKYYSELGSTLPTCHSFRRAPGILGPSALLLSWRKHGTVLRNRFRNLARSSSSSSCFSCEMSCKRVADERNLDDTPSVVPQLAASTLRRVIDVDPAVDEAKRRRLEHPDPQNDAKVVESVQNAQPDIVQQQPDAKAILAPIMQQFHAMSNLVDAMYNRVDAMENLMDVMVRKVSALENRQNVDVVMAFAINGAAVNRSAPVQPVPRLVDMEVPPGFPETLGELKDLDGAAVKRFLKFYSISIDGNVCLRRNRLFAHLGINLNV